MKIHRHRNKTILIAILVGLFFVMTSSIILSNNNRIRIKIVENQWKFEPNTIIAKAGEPLELRIMNEDAYAHGFFIKELEVNEWLPPKKETVIPITPQKPGTFGFYCSVLCGEGHYRMSGQIIVKE